MIIQYFLLKKLFLGEIYTVLCQIMSLLIKILKNISVKTHSDVTTCNFLLEMRMEEMKEELKN